MNPLSTMTQPGTYQTQGSSAIAFDSSRLQSLISSRNSRFHLDLSNATLVEVLEAKEAFSKKMNPRYKLSHIIGFVKRLEDEIGVTIMPIDVTDEFYVEISDFLLNVPGPNGKTLKPSSLCNYFSSIQGALSWGGKHRAQISETYNCWKSQSYERHKIALSPSMIAHIYIIMTLKTNLT